MTTIARVDEQTRGMTKEQLEGYRQTQLALLQRAHGEKLQERLHAVDDMIDELEVQQPGLLNLLGSNGIGRSAMVWNALISHVPIYHARKRR